MIFSALLAALALIVGGTSGVAGSAAPAAASATTPVSSNYDQVAHTSHLRDRSKLRQEARSAPPDAARTALRTTAVAAFAAEETGGLASADRTCSVNSFTGATLVTMADGSKKPIRDLEVGDKVVATDPETGETAARPVTKLIVHSGRHTMVDVHLTDGTMITATDRHPFWDATTGAFTYAVDLRPGDKVRELDGTLLAVARTHVYDADVTAYNLTVDGIHTYYAGTTPVLVHNSCGGDEFLTKGHLDDHYDLHGAEMGTQSPADYQVAASDLTCTCGGGRPGVLRKYDNVSGQGFHWDPTTGEFGITRDGGIITYYNLEGGLSSWDGMPGLAP